MNNLGNVVVGLGTAYLETSACHLIEETSLRPASRPIHVKSDLQASFDNRDNLLGLHGDRRG